jgi:hypothetical protein
MFSALVSAVDGSPQRPGSAGIIATMVVLDDDVRDYRAPPEPSSRCCPAGKSAMGGPRYGTTVTGQRAVFTSRPASEPTNR